jgi:hypothetical protein
VLAADAFVGTWKRQASISDRRLPVGREFFHMENAGGRLGYDPVSGLEGRISRADYANTPEDLAKLFKATQAKPKGSNQVIGAEAALARRRGRSTTLSIELRGPHDVPPR